MFIYRWCSRLAINISNIFDYSSNTKFPHKKLYLFSVLCINLHTGGQFSCISCIFIHPSSAVHSLSGSCFEFFLLNLYAKFIFRQLLYFNDYAATTWILYWLQIDCPFFPQANVEGIKYIQDYICSDIFVLMLHRKDIGQQKQYLYQYYFNGLKLKTSKTYICTQFFMKYI